MKGFSFNWIIDVFKIRCRDVVQGLAEVVFELLSGVTMPNLVGKNVLQCGEWNLEVALLARGFHCLDE